MRKVLDNKDYEGCRRQWEAPKTGAGAVDAVHLQPSSQEPVAGLGMSGKPGINSKTFILKTYTKHNNDKLKKKKEIPYNPASSSPGAVSTRLCDIIWYYLGIKPKEMKAQPNKHICVPMFLVALFTVIRTGKLSLFFGQMHKTYILGTFYIILFSL